MPRQRIDHGRIVYVLPSDFPERLKLLQKESGLSWAEIARRLGTYHHTVGRWTTAGVRPSAAHDGAAEAKVKLALAFTRSVYLAPPAFADR